MIKKEVSRIVFIKLILIVLHTVPTIVSGQSTLPQCTGTDQAKWHNCVGVKSFPNGRYSGEFKGGKLTGFGTFAYREGQRYVGDWKDDKREGFGTLTDTKGNRYAGDWLDGKPHGQGTAMLQNRTKFVGNYRNGKRNGEGILYAADGSVEASGLWKDDVLLTPDVLDTSRFAVNRMR